jgi:hypothetical protein
MTRRTFAIELETATDQIADVFPADLQILLRRAALVRDFSCAAILPNKRPAAGGRGSGL